MKVPAVQPAHAYLTATVNRIPLRTIMDVTAPENYGDLGFDTAVTGPVKVEWGGAVKDIADTVEVDGDLTFAPTGVKRKGALIGCSGDRAGDGALHGQERDGADSSR